MSVAKLRSVGITLAISSLICVGAVVSNHVAGTAILPQEQPLTPKSPTAKDKREAHLDEKTKNRPAKDQPVLESKVRQLQKDRLAALREIAAEKENAYQQGVDTIEHVLQARQLALRAELELCESDNESKLLEEIVHLGKELEKYADERFKAGRLPHHELLTDQGRAEAEVVTSAFIPGHCTARLEEAISP